MRISDWSSDVCSSDLRRQGARHLLRGPRRPRAQEEALDQRIARLAQAPPPRGHAARRVAGSRSHQGDPAAPRRAAQERRSEEHTSELQSLMRISYAVFCLKKKKITSIKYTHHILNIRISHHTYRHET